MAQRLEQLSNKQLAVCSTHTPVTSRKEVVLVKRQTQIRVARRPRRLVIVVRFRGRVFSLAPRRASRTGGQRGHHFSASSAVRSAYAVWNRAVDGSNPSQATTPVRVRVAKRPKAHACKALNSSVRLRSRTPNAWWSWCRRQH